MTNKKPKKITTTKTITKSEQSKNSAKSLLKEIEEKIVHLQKQLSLLSKLRKTAVQLSNGNMKNYLGNLFNEKETNELIIQMKNDIKELNIKPSTT